MRTRIVIFGVLALALVAVAQRSGRFRRGFGGGGGWGESWNPVYETCQTAREVPSHSTGTPMWTNEPGFEKDTFTFVRIRRDRSLYKSNGGGHWWTDFPDSDLNLSFRIQQVTSVRTDPEGRVLRLTDPALFDYPWIYMVEPGSLRLRDEEVPILRNYILNGGVLMADDFWGGKQWDQFEIEIKRAFPEQQYQFVELPMSNEVFRCVFDLSKLPKNKLQTPNVMLAKRSLEPSSPEYGITWEYYHDDYDRYGARDMHVRAMFDDKGRILVIATHNCDNGDGWEREGEDDGFFHEFSEKRAYPLGFNIVFYLMTH